MTCIIVCHVREFSWNYSLRKIDGTKMMPLGYRLVVRKTVPFGTLFWCPFAKGLSPLSGVKALVFYYEAPPLFGV